MLKSSNISKDMAMKNKEALVDCFAYIEDHSKAAPLPKVDDFIQDLEQGLYSFSYLGVAALLRYEDPMKVYEKIDRRLGEGASGKVLGIRLLF